MIKVVIIFLLSLLFTFKAHSHSGNTGPTGCHMNYATANYHCHTTKQANPYKTYYYIKPKSTEFHVKENSKLIKVEL